MEPDEYERIAATQDEHWWYRGTSALLEEILVQVLDRQPHDRLRILDAGCGPGANMAMLSGHGDVIGVDASPDALTLALRRHPSTTPVLARVEELPFRSGSFDVIVVANALYTVGPYTEAVAQLAEALRPGGSLIVMEPAFRSLHRAHDRQVHGARRFRRHELRAQLAGVGLTVERSTYAYSFLAPPAGLLALADRLRASRPSEVRSDVQRRQLDRLFAPLAAAERRWLRGHDLRVGTSVVVVATRP